MRARLGSEWPQLSLMPAKAFLVASRPAKPRGISNQKDYTDVVRTGCRRQREQRRDLTPLRGLGRRHWGHPYGMDNCGRHQVHLDEPLLGLDCNRTLDDRVRSPLTNGFVERMNRILLLDECFRVAGRTTWCTTVDEIQAEVSRPQLIMQPYEAPATYANYEGKPTIKSDDWRPHGRQGSDPDLRAKR